MKLSKGKADPALVGEILERKLKAKMETLQERATPPFRRSPKPA
jgi:hypothetical protein